MLERGRPFHDAPAIEDRARFCEANGVSYKDCVFQLILYDEQQTYSHIAQVAATDTTSFREEVPGDGLFTVEKNVGLFLPVADCTAAVVYDPVQQFLGLLHLGRHATYADLAAKAVQYFMEQGSRAEDLTVWMSPGAKRETYTVDVFDYDGEEAWHGFYEKREGMYFLDLPGFNQKRFIDSGVRAENIEVSPINTMTDDHYFSHRTGDANGRMAVLAMMR
jgi:copper oxidase (laccase) domain-containing protein